MEITVTAHLIIRSGRLRDSKKIIHNMSGVLTRNGRKDERHNNRRIIDTLTIDYQDRKIAQKNG